MMQLGPFDSGDKKNYRKKNLLHFRYEQPAHKPPRLKLHSARKHAQAKD